MHSTSLTSGNILHLYARYLIPTIIAMVSQSLYCLADVYFIAQGAGPLGLAALNIAMPIFTFYSAFGLLMGVGCATTISILDGAGKKEEKNRAFTMAIVVTILISLVFSIGGIVFLDEFALLLGATKELLPLVKEYIFPIHLLSVFSILTHVLQVLIRADHNPSLVMKAMVTSSLANIGLDYLFVMVWNGGMKGAAIATGIAPILSVTLLSLHRFYPKRSLAFVKSFHSFGLLKRMISNGISSASMEVSVSVITIVFNYVILSIGDEMSLAAYAIVTNIAFVCKGILNGFAQGIQPLISTNFGAGNLKRVEHCFWIAFGITTCFGLFGYLMIFLFPKTFVSLFASELALITLGIHGVILYFTSLPFTSANTIILYYFQSIEQYKKAMVLSLLRGFVMVMIFVWSFSILFGMDGVWLSIPFAEGSVWLFGMYLVYKSLKKVRKEYAYVTDFSHGITE